MDLFGNQESNQPLALEMRPSSLKDYSGQERLINQLTKLLPNLPHLILWGPPGSGKTSLAHLFAKMTQYEIYSFNAVSQGIPDLKKLIHKIIENKNMFQKKSILFVDEVHRFNKSQQDALLPHLERSDFLFIGATTEYPKTSLNKAILSRVKLGALEKLSKRNIIEILKRADLPEIEDQWLEKIAIYSNGDARIALNLLETINKIKPESESELVEILNENSRQYDKSSNRHYDVISAFIKSIRGSDVNAALLWLAVMLDGGEDIEFIARRLIIIASEDIGLVNPNALQVATDTHYAIKNIGMPEARIILSHATISLAQSAKSNKAYLAINKAIEFVQSNPTLEVPPHLKSSGPGRSQYLYPHDYPNNQVDQKYFAENVKDITFYKEE